MLAGPSLADLLAYTAWERQQWRDWLRQHGNAVLTISVGPHGDGRFATVGDVVRHIFSAEKRYVERVSGQPLSDTASIATDDIDALFRLGQESRTELTELLASFPAEQWDAPKHFTILNHPVTATPKKIVVHILIHEIRHWAQIATVLRVNGLVGKFHDFLMSPVMEGELDRGPGRV